MRAARSGGRLGRKACRLKGKGEAEGTAKGNTRPGPPWGSRVGRGQERRGCGRRPHGAWASRARLTALPPSAPGWGVELEAHGHRSIIRESYLGRGGGGGGKSRGVRAPGFCSPPGCRARALLPRGGYRASCGHALAFAETSFKDPLGIRLALLEECLVTELGNGLRASGKGCPGGAFPSGNHGLQAAGKGGCPLHTQTEMHIRL